MFCLILSAFAAKPIPVPFSGPPDSDPVRIAIVGALPEDPAALAEAVLGTDPDLLVFTGLSATDAVWPGEHATMAMASSNPRGRFLKRFEGIGVEGRSTPYGTEDFRVGDKRWRILYATTYASPLARWNEQQFWTPRAADPSSYDRLILLLDTPVFTASSRSGQNGSRIVLDDVQDVTRPVAMPLVIAGNSDTNETFLPGGPFGELHLVAGNSGVEPAEEAPLGLSRRPDAAPGFEEAVPRDAVGFWTVELHGGNVVVRFHRRGEADYTEAWRLIRDGSGWHLPQ